MDTLNSVTITLPEGAITKASIAPTAGIETTKLETRTSQLFTVPLTSGFVWDAAQTRLPGTATSDDLAIITGTPGTDAIRLRTSDGKATTITQKAGYEIQVPQNYKDAQPFAVRIRAGMITTVSDGTATVDLSVYKVANDGSVGTDLVTTAAQDINSLTADNFDFTVDATAIDPGDNLIAVITIAITDTATGTAVIGQINRVQIVCSTQG